MRSIDFIKLQAKNLFRDYKTQTSHDDAVLGKSYAYDPKHFDIGKVLSDYKHILKACRWDEGNLTLMNIQHVFANMRGFEKWADFVKAFEAEPELEKLLFDNQEKLSVDAWRWQVSTKEHYKKASLTTDERLAMLKEYFLHANKGVSKTYFLDYRLKTRAVSANQH
ncbi:MAG: hypothetical protein KF835_14415 [Xanthobacteraceae bacterium]|nr:hypothetical protein [Xanthobacteraceae bacterium]